MKATDISNIRLFNQHIAEEKLTTPKDIVGWMGAMQAQDFNMAKWAVGVRLPNATEKLIDEALDRADILRTHLMRPTWHFVTSADIHWMLALTAPRIMGSMKSRDKELELTETVYQKSNAVIEKILRDGQHLLRNEIAAELHKVSIATDDNRLSHILFRAELTGIACSGKARGGKQTYALLHERVPETTSLNRDEALARLALKYFTSHSPATLGDFIWWSGLAVADAKHALEMVKPKFVSETIGDQTYWFTNSLTIPKAGAKPAHLLPAFDEFIISYKDRTASLARDHHAKAVSNNGIFWPIIVVDGQVTGIWKRILQKNSVQLETNFFRPPGTDTQQQVEKAFTYYSRFLNK